MKHQILFRIIFIINLLWISCATPSSVSGGKGDEVPPKVANSKPENQQKNAQTEKITLHFDSYIKGATYGKEILVSPLPTKPPKIIFLNKNLTIQFQEPLKENTTYVISVNDVQDAFTSQKMAETYVYAFSTGNELDTMKVNGKVIDGVTQTGAKDMTVLLFDADSIVQNEIFKKRPEYIAKTNAEGNFSFTNLKKKKYKIYAIQDADQSNSYNQSGERLALGKNPALNFPDSVKGIVFTDLVAFLPDENAPMIKSYEWLGMRELALEIDETPLLNKLSVAISDTFGKQQISLPSPTFFKEEKKWLLFTFPQKRDTIQQISLKGLTDSLGNARDTIFKLPAKKITKKRSYPLLKNPEYQVTSKGFELFAPQTLLDSLAANFTYLDSANKKQPIVVQKQPFSLLLLPAEGTKWSAKGQLQLKGKSFLGKDSTLKYPTLFPKNTELGNLSGKVTTQGYEGKIVLILQSGKSGGKGTAASAGTEIIWNDRAFNFKDIKVGKYSAKVIFDEDGNGVWTTGSLKTGKLPEKIFNVQTPIEVRGNWDMEDVEIVAPFSAQTKGETSKGAKTKI
ncbi:MAG: Ig-like domain-containing protein [Bacteroidia bacterium]